MITPRCILCISASPILHLLTSSVCETTIIEIQPTENDCFRVKTTTMRLFAIVLALLIHLPMAAATYLIVSYEVFAHFW